MTNPPTTEYNPDHELCHKCGCPIHPCLPCEEVVQLNGNHTDDTYNNLIRLILDEGRRKKNRTGVDTIGVFGAQAKFEVRMDAFPILTTKKVWFKGIVHELLWFLKGDTNIKYLVDNGVHIWDEWAYAKYAKVPLHTRDHADMCQMPSEQNPIVGEVGVFRVLTQPEFIDRIKNDTEFAEKWGELGKGTYGSMWRDFPCDDVKNSVHTLGVDQIATVLNKLRDNPDDRRMIVSAWHPYWAHECALSPCHCFMQFNTEELTLEERENIHIEKYGHAKFSADPHVKMMQLNDVHIPIRRLNLLMLIRSNDAFLGMPFNISNYSLLIAMVAHCVGMEPGTLTYTIGDLHLYTNHLDQVKEQLTRVPKLLPKLWLNPKVTDLFDFTYDDIKLIDYKSHPAIKGVVAV